MAREDTSYIFSGMAENEVQKIVIGSLKAIESIWLRNQIYFYYGLSCHRPVDFYWLYECKAIYL